MSFSHFDAQGAAVMVDITDKAVTDRSATAVAHVVMREGTLAASEAGQLGKGDVLGVARLAGIMGAKRTADLIPLCHPLPLSSVKLEFALRAPDTVVITATARTTGRTGVEMEALTAASVAALTIYDMCKAIDRGMHIEGVRLLHKSGGASGVFTADAPGE
jgi:cyclic pyranopterin phosphate synthase